MLSIDRREVDLVKLAMSKGLIDSVVTVDGSMLNGDLHIFKEVGKPIIILERKKVSDFRASHEDKRWAEQR
jgi:ERCC4-type nuclease